MHKNEIIFGTWAVVEALRASSQLEKIFVQKGLNTPLVKELIACAYKQHIPLSFTPRQKLDRLTSKHHQGVVAIRSAVHYAVLEAIIHRSYSEGQYPFFLLLDRITNVGNFGAIVRTAECAGLHAVVVASKGSALLTGDAVRASAGALHHLPVCRVRDLKEGIRVLKENGIRIVACTERADTELYDIDMQGPLALLLGSEEDGIAPDLYQDVDASAKIPMRGNIQSLNVSAAASVAVYEAVRQNRDTKKKVSAKKGE